MWARESAKAMGLAFLLLDLTWYGRRERANYFVLSPLKALFLNENQLILTTHIHKFSWHPPSYNTQMYLYVNQLRKNIYDATRTKCTSMLPKTKKNLLLFVFAHDAFVSVHNRSKIGIESLINLRFLWT